ncbi:hypothetical protein PoB_007496200 [Plakobranchus ocellatus]|uniref:Uncharacterized protein n=1 Tax=Plakobranchus ocellatus TaxID=259542 RepID=A0AAV4DWQ3_9GAST|nr:hypothetical protein PoB_007496200 [Plakobranchus ocellatus]
MGEHKCRQVIGTSVEHPEVSRSQLKLFEIPSQQQSETRQGCDHSHIGPDLAPPMVVWPCQIVFCPKHYQRPGTDKDLENNESQETSKQDTVVFSNFISSSKNNNSNNNNSSNNNNNKNNNNITSNNSSISINNNSSGSSSKNNNSNNNNSYNSTKNNSNNKQQHHQQQQQQQRQKHQQQQQDGLQAFRIKSSLTKQTKKKKIENQ